MAEDEPLYAHHLAKRPDLFRPYREDLLKAQNSNGEEVFERLCKGTGRRHYSGIVVGMGIALTLAGQPRSDATAIAPTHEM